MGLRYTSKALPALCPDFQHIAGEVLGAVDWRDAHTGYCQCPGAHLHTNPTRERDCRVSLDGENGFAPTLHCFHDSCRAEVEEANSRLRSSLGRASWLANGRVQPAHPANQWDDPFETFMRACFEPGDIVSIAPGVIPEGETRAVPENAGVNVLTRDEWIERACDKGGIARLFSTPHGLYLRVNPIQKKSRGGDKDVTRYRHTLVESDTLPKREQERILRASGLPISALIDSGGSSVHAWVRVDADSTEQYHERRKRIWDALPDLGIDEKNKNPSRFSRCPGARRGEGLQKLLAVALGPPSYAAWEALGNGLGLAPPLRVSELYSYDTENDPNTVLGNRWLCRGGSLLVVGQSGIGKSSISMQMAVLWALGLPVFNIRPVKPLKSLVIQAENDIGDLAEMFQGVREGMGLTQEQMALLEENLVFYRDTIHCGAEFAKTADALIKKHQPDLVWADPLLNYIGDDASQQRVVSEFCGHLLNPICERTGIIWCFMHHTGKPTSDPKARSHWTSSDVAYSGLGSSALTNWAREVAVLTRLKTPPGHAPTFRFELTKRRRRAGLTDLHGNPTEAICIRHGDTGICWLQCDDPLPEEGPKTTYTIGGKGPRGRPKALEEAIPEFDGLTQLGRELIAELSAKYGISESTVKRHWQAHRKANHNKKDTTNEV